MPLALATRLTSTRTVTSRAQLLRPPTHQALARAAILAPRDLRPLRAS